jgi:hypothetical protein
VPARHQWSRKYNIPYLDFVPSEITKLHMAIELQACCVPEDMCKVHDPLVDLDDATFFLERETRSGDWQTRILFEGHVLILFLIISSGIHTATLVFERGAKISNAACSDIND